MNGRTYAVAAGTAYGTLGVFSRLFYDHGGTSFTLLVLRFCGGAAIFATIVMVRRRSWPTRRDALLAIALGPAQLAATFCLFVGFAHASPGLVVLLFYVYPLLVTLGAGPILGERLGRRRAVLLTLGMVGIALTVGVPQSTSALGIACGLSAGVFTATFMLGSHRLLRRSVDPFQFIALAYGGSAVLLLAAAEVHGLARPSNAAAGYALAVIVGGTVIPALFFYSAIRAIGAGAAARLATVEPLTAVVLSVLVLGDSFNLGQVAGGALVLTSVVLLATAPATFPRRTALLPGE